ncbi:MAG TPA: HypC/HybG/HupF family hydrogenase formation chaperone [Streptosporangiaceae bacterium]|nr:HypC/HybG/HupF family hydrogenase formation chaperone [Streptosporangiaceae bacterium]
MTGPNVTRPSVTVPNVTGPNVTGPNVTGLGRPDNSNKGPGQPPQPGQPGVPGCHDEVCITCSDAAVAVRVVRLLDDGLAIVDTGAGEEEVSVALVSASVGDTVLVHAKEALAVVGGEHGDRAAP